MGEVFSTLKSSDRNLAQIAYSGSSLFGGKVPLEGGKPNEGWELIEAAGKAYIAVCNCTFPQERAELVLPEELTEFHFTLSGPVSVADVRSVSEANSLSIFICRTGTKASYRVTCGKGPRRSVALYVHNAFLERLMDGSCEQLGSMREELNAVAAEDVFMRRLPINQSLVELVERIISNPHNDQRRLVYAEAKCVELLCETIDLWRAHRDPAAPTLSMRPRDIAMLTRARKLILEDLTTVPSVPDLARILGTNNTKLTTGFRLLFGTTVHRFALEAKMEHALSLLVQRRLSVGAIAEAVGYQHQSSFTLAFSRHFGFSPSSARTIVPTDNDVASTSKATAEPAS